MYNTAEQNELRRRRSALVLAIALHLGLAATIYLLTSDKPETARPGNSLAQQEKEVPAPHTKAAQIP